MHDVYRIRQELQKWNEIFTFSRLDKKKKCKVVNIAKGWSIAGTASKRYFQFLLLAASANPSPIKKSS